MPGISFLLLFFFFFCQAPANGFANTQVQESLSAPLKIAYCRYMPFYFEGIDQKPRGILVDLWKLWSKKTGVGIEFSLLTWEEAIRGVETGQVDINAFMYKTPGRDLTFDFSQPVFDLTTHLFFRNDSAVKSEGFKNIGFKNLGRIKTGGVTADFSLNYLKHTLAVSGVTEYPDHESLVRAALRGDVEAFLMEGPVALTYLAKHNGLDIISKSPEPLYTKDLHAGVKQGKHALLSLVNKGFSKISPQEIDQIFQNWTGEREERIWRPRGKLVISASIDNMPFHFKDQTGKAVGMFVDLWRLWSKKTGIDIEFVTAPWAESLELVKRGKADIHAGCFFSVQRDTYLDYAGELKNCETHFFFHESIFGLKNIQDLKGFKIGVLDQDYALEFVNRELPDAALEIYDSHRSLFDGVEKGEIKVFICDTPTALYFLSKKKLLPRFRYHPARPLYRKPFFAAVKEGNTPLVNAINKGLGEITSQERAVIERQWMGTSNVKPRDALIIGLARSFPPFSMRNAQGNPSGLFVDMWNTWSEKTGKPVAFRLYSRGEAIHALKDGIVDVLATMPPGGMVKGWVNESIPYYRLDWYLYHIPSQSVLDPASGLGDLSIGAVTHTLARDWLEINKPHARIIGFETTRQMIQAAADGTIRGFLATPQEMSILPGRLALPMEFYPSERPLIQQQARAYVRQYNPALVRAIDQGFDDIPHGEMVQIEKKWIGVEDLRFFSDRNEQVLLSDLEEKWLTRHQQSGVPIRLGINPSWPPFEFMGKDERFKGKDARFMTKDARFMGMVSDYVTLLNKRLGLNMEVVQGLTLSQVFTGAHPLSRTIDVLPSALSFEEKKDYMAYTHPYLSFPWVIINKRQAPLIGGLRDLYGKKLAVVNSYTMAAYLEKNHPQISLLAVDATKDGLRAVNSGRADAYAGNLAVAGYQMQAKNFTELKVAASAEFENSGLAFAVRQDWPELVSILDKGLLTITEQEQDHIRQKWFSIRFEHGVNMAYIQRLVLKIGLGVLVILGLFFLWNRQIRRREERFRCLTEHGTDIIQAILPDGSISYQSPSHTPILGYEPQKPNRTKVVDLIHPADVGPWQAMLKRLMKKDGMESIVLRFRHCKGHYLFFESNCINLIQNKALKAIVLNGRDITHRIKTQKEMEKAKETAEAANQSKSDFLASLSHEIRTPLNAILGMTDMTLKTQLTLRQGKNLNTVRASAKHLLDVISDILDFSIIEAGKMRIKPQVFNLIALLDTLEHAWSLQANEKGLGFDLCKKQGIPTYVKSDPIRLFQVLTNLIANAVKFTHTGEISIQVGPHKKEAGSNSKELGNGWVNESTPIYLSFKVQDTGIGIQKEHLENIFHRFTQAQGSITREYGGTGLGLAICREVAQLMGGSLGVTSQPLQGSCFTLVLPFESVSELEKSKFGSNPPAIKTIVPLRPLTLLLAEDDPMNARVFQEFLLDKPYKIIRALDGIEAVQCLKTHEIDMVFMDLEMPRLDGLRATQKIRKGEAGMENSNLPIIAMTAHVLAEFKQKAREAGMNDFIPKPVDVDQLYGVIDHYFPTEKHEQLPINENDEGDMIDAKMLDRKEALAALGGNQLLLARIYEIFTGETPALMEKLEQALGKKDVQGIRLMAHTLKGAGARVYSPLCTRAAKELEVMASTNNWNQIMVLGQDVLTHFGNLIDILTPGPTGQ